MNRYSKMVFASVFVLLMVGVIMIYSSSAVYSLGKYGDSFFYVKKQIMYLFFGLVSSIICMALPYGFIRDNSRKLMLFFIVLLLVVLIPGIGKQVGGARRWLSVFGFSIQPSEFAKLALIIYLSDLTSRKRFVINNLKYGFLPALGVTVLTGMIVLAQPDMGTAVSIIFIGFVILYASGAKLKHLAVVASCSLPLLVTAIICAPYRMKRILAFFDPWANAKGSGFQLIQSFIALGSGGAWGVGLGGSKQKLFYLPESHTDFIFSIIGEELGFLGTALILVIFGVLIWYLLRISFKIKELFYSKIVLGIGVMIAFEVILNIGVSTGLLPTKGLPLPFVSYGGTSVICHMLAIGLVINIAREVE